MVDIAIVAFCMLIVLLFGLKSGTKADNLEHYAYQKRSQSTLMIVATIFATLVAGSATMGVAEKIFSIGITFIMACFGFVIRDLITAYFIMPKFEPIQNCHTAGDIMAHYYGRPGKIIVGILGTLQCSVYLSVQLAALAHLLHYFMNVPFSMGLTLSLGFIMIYAIAGGLKSVTLLDVIQFGVLVIAIPVTFTIGVELVGGFQGLINSAPSEKLSFLPRTGEQVWAYSLLFVFMLPSVTPVMIGRFLMGNNLTQVRKALIVSALARIPFFIMVAVLGLIAIILAPHLDSTMAFIYVVQTILPVGIKGIVIAAFIALIISTADSLLYTAGFLLTHDVIKPIYKDRLSEEEELRMARWMMVIVAIPALVTAMSTENIIELVIISHAFWLPTVAIPLVACVMGMQASRHGFFLSILVGGATYWAWQSLFFEQLYIDGLLPSTTLGGLTYFFTYVFEKRESSQTETFLHFAPKNTQLVRLVEKSTKNAANFFSRTLSRLVEQSAQRVEVFGAPYGMFVLFSVANLCFVPFIFANTSGGVTPNFVIYLRVIASIFSFLLVMKDFWARALLKYLPLYWHITLFFCLPYFAITMCLFTSCAIEWVIDLVLTIFILGILVDWKTYISTILLGAFLATCSFVLFGDLTQFDPNIGNFPIMTYAIIVSVTAGALFSRNKERVLMEKLVTFKALGGTIAHEMRTPLSSIHVSASGLKEWLPALVDGYTQARMAGIRVPKISQLALESVASIPERMRYICASSLNIIDMLLMQLKDNDWNEHFSSCSIKECVDIALNEYCFRENEKLLIDIRNVKDFTFYGNRYLVVHILYNLMRNAFTFIQSEKKGDITLWTTASSTEWHLHFRDTAKGIHKDDIAHVFDHGFSKRSGGSGVGLHYCRRMMTAMSGSITVNSIEGEYCEFILTFSKRSP